MRGCGVGACLLRILFLLFSALKFASLPEFDRFMGGICQVKTNCSRQKFNGALYAR
jgi:hypothetical protein